MRFDDFAAAHGLMLRHVEFGKWVRVPTTDHPAKKNGAYRHLGDVAFVQNHATMDSPVTWFPDGDNDIRIDAEAIRRRCEKAARELQEGRQKAANRAGWMMHQCTLEKHAYMDAHGQPDVLVNVWRPTPDVNLMVVPMSVDGSLVGCQLIDKEGGKRFLAGQTTKMAEYVINNKGENFFCEGYSTGISLQQALRALKMRYTIRICFSAGNIQNVAKRSGSGIVIADRDASGTGERSAIATGLPYFLPPVGDFNDYVRAVGVFMASQELRKFLSGVHR